MKTKYILAVLFISLILILGIIGGIAGSMIYHKQAGKDRCVHRSLSSRDKIERMEYLTYKLSLNPQQIEAIRIDLDIATVELEKLHSVIRPRFEKIHQQMREAIKKHLSSEQMTIFREMSKHRRQMLKHLGGEGSRGGSDYKGRPGFRGNPGFNEDRRNPKTLRESGMLEKEK